MKKVVFGILMGLMCLGAFGYEYPFSRVREEDKSHVIPFKAIHLNERYKLFNYTNLRTQQRELRLKDMESENEIVLQDDCYVYPFELRDINKILVWRRGDAGFYMNDDLSYALPFDSEFYNFHPFYDGAAIVTPSGQRSPVMINTNGEIVCDKINTSKGYFSEGVVFCTFKDGSCGFLNPKGEVEIEVPGKYWNGTDVKDYEFHDGLVVMKQNGARKDVIMNRQGQIVYETSDYLDFEFIDGMISFKTILADGQWVYGYMDKDLKIVVPATKDNKTQQGYGVPTYKEWLERRKK